ncbi:hypothetical protein [Spiroplasma phoeniceum]|nr:hypothetical protein [Spiroplasma phoeniceum]
MLTKSRLNAEVYFIVNSKSKNIKKIKAHFVENLAINSKIIILEDLLIEENDNVIVNDNVFKISQKIIHKHPIKKNIWKLRISFNFSWPIKKFAKISNINFKSVKSHFIIMN